MVDSSSPTDSGHLVTSACALVVDDDASMRELIQIRLVGRGLRVVTACNGSEALTRLAESHPDLVITDWQMPILNGIQLIQAIRADPALDGLPIILFSGETGDAVRTALGPIANVTCVQKGQDGMRGVVSAVEVAGLATATAVGRPTTLGHWSLVSENDRS